MAKESKKAGEKKPSTKNSVANKQPTVPQKKAPTPKPSPTASKPVEPEPKKNGHKLDGTEKSPTSEQIVRRKESLAVLMLPIASAEPNAFNSSSRLSVASSRRLSAESYRSLDFGHAINNGNTTLSIPVDSNDERVLGQSTDDSYIRSAIPQLPVPIAAICLIMNIIAPGTGTVISGFSIFCCGRSRLRLKGDEKTTTCCVNVWVGLAQLFTVSLCLVGWAWSVAWGVLILDLAVQYSKEEKKKRQMELQALALSAFATNESGIVMRKLPV